MVGDEVAGRDDGISGDGARLGAALRLLAGSDLVRGIALTLYYLALIATLILMYGGGRFTPPPFIYQGF